MEIFTREKKRKYTLSDVNGVSKDSEQTYSLPDSNGKTRQEEEKKTPQ